MANLGKLNQIKDVRQAWRDEARDFTPWLAKSENLAQLSECLGLGDDGLELEAVEKFVGPYRADILCRNTNNGEWVLIENQLDRSDHGHLGQLLVYAAGLDARIVIWISTAVSQEHKAAIEWLNELSGDGQSFFALEIELWQIGASPPAPRFNIAAGPNDWTRSATSAKKELAGDLTPTRQMQRDYWAEVEKLVQKAGGPLRPVSPLAQQWVSHGIGKTGVSVNFAIHTRESWARVEIYLSGSSAKERFAELSAQKSEIETECGLALDWQELPDGQGSRIAVYLKGCGPNDEEDWPRQHRWLVETGNLIHRVFKPRVAKFQ